MNQILIVDDEKNISKGIKYLLNYSAIDINNVFVAINGTEALDILRTNEITLLITDIKMEGMSGLELMHEAKLLYPWIQVIVISAFEDFENAQKAIQLGAKDYLIKPLNTDHLINSIRNCLLTTSNNFIRITDKVKEKNHPNIESYELNLSKEIENLKIENISNVNDYSFINIKNMDIAFYNQYHVVIQVKISTQKELDGNLLNNILALVIQTIDSSFNIKIFTSENIYLVLSWDKFEDVKTTYTETEYIEMIVRNWQYEINKVYELAILIGYSQILKGAHSIEELVKQTDEVLKLHKSESLNYTYYYGDYNWNLFKDGSDKSDFKTEEKIVIKNVKKYLKKNYTQSGLSLKQIAEANHISSNYLSYLFKQETGGNIWDYLIKLRMEESKYYLINTDMKIYEISEYVGYESADHFTKVFKKYFGESPSKMKKIF